MAVLKNFLIVLFVLSTVNLCLARPKWLWIGDDVEEVPMVARKPEESDVEEKREKEEEMKACNWRSDVNRCKEAVIQKYNDKDREW